ncbi:cyclic nucleotide-binding domain-containing protein [Synechocystis sp. LKSZ1]|uniref:cyclic nucleotide-binding domain-containing protein n=1 Tax=Synechocystis sp. LKSZ1 TaxID=3144951 RepID=UPI00336BB832
MSYLIDTVKIFETGKVQTYGPGEVIFQTGEQGTGMYGILAGEVEMQVDGQTVETLTSGNVFGIGAIVHPDHLRASTAIAKTNCQLAYMDREHFLFAVQQTPMFALEVMRSYSDRFRHLKAATVKAS